MGNQVSLSIDFENVVGKYKPMHGVGQPPITGLSNSLFHYLKRAEIPYSRLHDVGGMMGSGLFVDIPNIFTNFDADENDPDSYDFAYTDEIIKGLINNGCEPYFRLGVTIENAHMIKAHRIFPPKDFSKWARICEHIVRHYNEGWADGFDFGITYWEIWNEPDDCYTDEIAAMWKGTPEEYFELYSVTARHLKKCFGDTIKIGGYGHCGVYEFQKDTQLKGIENEEYIYDFTINFFHNFLKYQKETNAPIDFFSWHVYDNCHPSTKDDFLVIAKHAEYVRKVLDHYGYVNTEHHLNEWNLWTKKKYRDSNIGSAKTLAFMLMMQNTSTDVMCFYDAGMGFSDYRSLLSPETGYPYRTYYTFMMFSSLFNLENQVKTEINDKKIFVGAGKKGKKAVIVISNVNDYDVRIVLDINNFPTDEVQILRIDEENRYTLTGENLKDNNLVLPPYSCMEIKLWDIN
ncbi:MAG: hypothetical protein II234_02265 [Clostridia bacterium]|nr:hypothetical protein [Clostridia bacterium]